MKAEIRTIKICPKCGGRYGGVPVLSREDSKSFICPDCGTREALEQMGIDKQEQQEIIKTIHRCYRQ
ncbi:MAG: hypothetical protein K2K21_05900 [Lachnospiraceae bacterium]|nr:hypothetical protein [Lachnospiraceae bacterium]